jgi:hypothetical protein
MPKDVINPNTFSFSWLKRKLFPQEQTGHALPVAKNN